MTHHIIYKTTNSVNGKFYIGMHSTNDLNDGYIGSGVILWKAVEKYGISNFKTEVLEYCSSRIDLCECEIKWINELDAVNSEMSYNLRAGGNNPYIYVPTEEVRRKISNTLKGRKQPREQVEKALRNRSKAVWSDAARQRIIAATKLRVFSESTLQQMSMSARNKPPMSVETRKKLSLAATSQPVNTCPHCGVSSKNIGILRRYHFDNCLVNPALTETDVLLIKEKRRSESMHGGMFTKINGTSLEARKKLSDANRRLSNVTCEYCGGSFHPAGYGFHKKVCFEKYNKLAI